MAKNTNLQLTLIDPTRPAQKAETAILKATYSSRKNGKNTNYLLLETTTPPKTLHSIEILPYQIIKNNHTTDLIHAEETPDLLLYEQIINAPENTEIRKNGKKYYKLSNKQLEKWQNVITWIAKTQA